jgi:CBS domain containing-hemolysin-like protein
MLELSRQTGKSRFPVYESTLDSVLGVAGVIDAFAVPVAARATTPVRAVAREAVLVPESLDLDGVLTALQDAGADVAIVVDEYGGTDGLVTIEDLVEELVGDISDEHDAVAPAGHGPAPRGSILDPLVPDLEGLHTNGDTHTGPTGGAEVTVSTGVRTFLVDGVLREDELAEVTGFRLPEGPYETLAGFLMARLGHIPVAGETVVEGEWEFTVIEVLRRRVEQVRIVAPEPDEDNP